jgi:hypothetical protein
LTPQELQDARRRAAAERAAEEDRLRQEEAERERRLADRKAFVKRARERHDHLQSVVDLLYDELDKLNRKWPNAPVSQRQLERVNKAIVGVRDLVKDDSDEFADITEFVAAGDPPETRDAVMALRELKGSLSRFHSRHRLAYTTEESLRRLLAQEEDEDD